MVLEGYTQRLGREIYTDTDTRGAGLCAHSHSYWIGPYGERPALAIKAALATQDIQRIQPLVWLDAHVHGSQHLSTPISDDLLFLQANGAKVCFSTNISIFLDFDV